MQLRFSGIFRVFAPLSRQGWRHHEVAPLGGTRSSASARWTAPPSIVWTPERPPPWGRSLQRRSIGRGVLSPRYAPFGGVSGTGPAESVSDNKTKQAKSLGGDCRVRYCEMHVHWT